MLKSLEFGIWDDCITCLELYGPNPAAGKVEWRLSRRQEYLDLYGGWLRLLRDAPYVDVADERIDELDLEEPMVTTAPLARELSQALCRGSYLNSEDCSWYHSIWQYLRVFNLVSTPTWHTNFYVDELARIARTGEGRRLLISGTADYSMLAHVLWAYERAAAPNAVTVLDLCETPLLLCRWYAKSVNKQVDVVAADIFAYGPAQPFDVIATDAFVTRFPADQRPGLLRRWHELLRKDGWVVTTVRIHNKPSGSKVLASKSESDDFAERAFEEAQRWQSFLRVSPKVIREQARTYAERMTSYSFDSESEVRALFESNGFRIQSLAVVSVPGEMVETTYAEIVARAI
jgi:hypothetical protein